MIQPLRILFLGLIPVCLWRGVFLHIHNRCHAAASTQKLSTEAQPTSSFVPSPSVEAMAPPAVPSTESSTPSIESPKPPGSRFFPNPSTADNAALQGQQDRQSASAIRSPIPSQFNPPPGSRLLAFGSRTPSATASANISPDQPSAFTITLDAPPALQHPVNGPHRIPDMDTSIPDSTARSSVATGVPPPGFSNLVNPTRVTGFLNDGNTQTQSEILRRQSLTSLGDRMTYGGTSDLGAYSEMASTNPLGPQSNIQNSQSPSFDSGGRERGHGGSPFPQQKGSRFAKFFDGKSREQPAAPPTEDLNPAHPLLSYQRQQGVVGGESYALGPENRTMEDIFAMLQNSTQVSCLDPVFSLCLMFIRDSASPNLLAMVKRPLFSSPGAFLPRGSLSRPRWLGIMTSCMTIAWTTATSSPMDWSRACVLRFRRGEIVGCFRTRLMNSAHLMSNNAFRRSEPWIRCTLHLSLPCTPLIK